MLFPCSLLFDNIQGRRSLGYVRIKQNTHQLPLSEKYRIHNKILFHNAETYPHTKKPTVSITHSPPPPTPKTPSQTIPIHPPHSHKLINLPRRACRKIRRWWHHDRFVRRQSSINQACLAWCYIYAIRRRWPCFALSAASVYIDWSSRWIDFLLRSAAWLRLGFEIMRSCLWR